ncbi:uncharacterized protein BX664DRAFT_260054 [Halteromyces radiatus]|uniref:uncharacterized protein n=1 Tax=Halteromyces radiatus TaxID=101107 RepID=UPI00222083CA|nr:uncharacterized protein BX664DRAFT_260054 [Halteromyces radiatus]KAI8093412.1 hypothetical protein BX664DRAFT_260054 [Halteromyces radiatus]
MDGHNNPWSNLDTLDTIEKDMNDLLNQPQQLSYNTLLHMFEGIRSQLVQWMEKAHLAIFTLEQQMKDGTIKTNILPLQSKVTKMESLMTRLPDISDMIDDKIDRTIENDDKSTQQIQFNMTITKLQSEWSGLHHFMLSVTKQFEAANEKRELLVIMEDILLNIDSLTSTIFQYQEKRHLAMVTTDNDDSTTSNTLKDESLLSDIDQRVDPVFLNVEKVYARMTSSRPPLDESGILVRKHRLVQEKWECLRIEIDELKDELKEDKWLFVFRQVADQVDTMINGLDKTVQQCYNTIQQIMDWHEQVQQQQQQLSSPHSPISIVPPLDREKFKAVEKNFEAKYKYYTPSIDRMLTMLGNGIASRVTKDSSTCKRQSAMLSRWQQLKTAMDDLRTRDLMDAERYLVETPLSESRANAGQINDDSPRQQHHQQGRKSHVPRPPSQQRHTKEASFMKPTKSTMLRTRSQSVEPPEIIRPKTPTRTKPTGNTNGGRRTKTPGTTTTTNSSAHLQYHLPPRPKSSLARQETYDMLPYVDRERQNGTKSPIRRTGTPSLIPRPKTPSGQKELMIRSASPSMIPRPRSSMKQYQDGQVIPPVPPLPSNIERPSIHLLKVGILNKEDVCNDDDGSEHPIYTGDPRDPLDMEVATILNSSPIAMQCQRSPQGGGKYYFGNELNPTLGGGKKLYTCKLINYSGRSSRRTHNNGDHVSMVTRNKVLVRVGGGWTELPQFLLDHALSLGNSTGLVIRHPVDQGAHQDTTVSSSSSSSYQDPSLHRFRSKRSPSMSSSNTDNTSGFLLDAHSSF